MENATVNTVNSTELNANTLLQITKALESVSSIPVVGCEAHVALLTKKIFTFYLTMRMHFICKEYNKTHNELREKTRERRKAAKLTSKSLEKKGNNFDSSKNNCCDNLNPQFTKNEPRKRKRKNVESNETEIPAKKAKK